MALFLAAQLVLVPWAGATTSLISGIVRAMAYHADYATYSPSNELARLAGNAGQDSEVRNRQQIAACARAEQAMAAAPARLALVEKHRNWLTSWLVPTEAIYAVQTVSGPDPALDGFRYRYSHAVSDRFSMEMGTYIFADQGTECRISAERIDKERVVLAADLRERFGAAARTVASTVARDRTHPLPWTVMASAGAAKDLGFSDVSLTPANDFARRLDTTLFWFQKIAFGLIVLTLLTPFKLKPREDSPAGG